MAGPKHTHGCEGQQESLVWHLALVWLQRPELTAGEVPGFLPGQGGTQAAGFHEWKSLWGESW